MKVNSPARIRVLFICIGNACRSPMAEAIARRDAPDIIEPSSAGLYPLGCIADLTTETLRVNGYPSEGLSSKAVTLEALRRADLIVNLSCLPLALVFKREFQPQSQPSCEIGENVEEWDVADPYGSDLNLYQQTFQEIEGRVRGLAERLRAVDRTAPA